MEVDMDMNTVTDMVMDIDMAMNKEVMDMGTDMETGMDMHMTWV